MKKVLFFAAIVVITVVSSCSSSTCQKCTNCKTSGKDATICEKDFQKKTDYNDKIDDMLSDSCTCVKQ